MQTDFDGWGCVVMTDMEKIEDVVFAIEVKTISIKNKLKGIKKLLDLINVEVFQTKYKPNNKDLMRLYYQVNYYSEINDLAVHNLRIVLEDIQKIEILTDELREEDKPEG